MLEHYEYIFWAMAAVVALALAGGALMGRCATTARSLAGIAAWSFGVLVVVAVLATYAGLGELVALLAIAAFMFSLVIGTAAALLTRRVRRQHAAGRAGQA